MAHAQQNKSSHREEAPFEFRFESAPVPIIIFIESRAARYRLIGDKIHDELADDELSEDLAAPPRMHPKVVRHKMLKAQSDAEVIKFLNDTGYAAIWSITTFRKWQRIVEFLLITPMRRWSRLYDTFPSDVEFQECADDALRPLNARLEYHDTELILAFRPDSTFEAIVATVLIDHLQRHTFKRCAREDCGEIFQLTSRHGQKYCQQYCGHLESLRKQRRKERARRKLMRRTTHAQ